MSWNPYWILENGIPVPEPNQIKWAMWMESLDNRIIEQTTLPDGLWLSTVFLGLDHGGFGRPVLFETMLFTKQGGESLDCVRHERLEEAQRIHKELVKWIAEQIQKKITPQNLSLT